MIRYKALSFLVLSLGILLLFAGCRFVPKGSILFKLKVEREYDKAHLKSPQDDAQQRPPIKLKWVDTNTFLTSGSITPGPYMLVARSAEGQFFSRDVMITPGRDYYELEPAQTSGTMLMGPPVTGVIKVPEGEVRPTELAVIFISHDVFVRRVPLKQDRWVAHPPAAGEYKVEVHSLGKKPLGWLAPLVDIKGPVDLGVTSLK